MVTVAALTEDDTTATAATPPRHRRDRRRHSSDSLATLRDIAATPARQPATHRQPIGDPWRPTRDPARHSCGGRERCRERSDAGSDAGSGICRDRPATAGDPSATHRRQPATGPRRPVTHPQPIGDGVGAGAANNGMLRLPRGQPETEQKQAWGNRTAQQGFRTPALPATGCNTAPKKDPIRTSTS